MPTAAKNVNDTRDREVIQQRVFDAPRELVWEALTDARHLDQWWGPNGFRNETSRMDLRVGGEWRFLMHGPDGKEWINWIRYEEVVKPERLVYAHGGETDEPEFHVTLTLEAEGKRTKLTMRSVFPTAEALEVVKKFGAVEGGRQTLARLAGYLPHLADGSAREAMVVSRVFGAAVATVFHSWTKAGGPFSEEVANQRLVFDDDGLRTAVTFEEDRGDTLVTVRQPAAAGAADAQAQRVRWFKRLEQMEAAARQA